MNDRAKDGMARVIAEMQAEHERQAAAQLASAAATDSAPPAPVDLAQRLAALDAEIAALKAAQPQG